MNVFFQWKFVTKLMNVIDFIAVLPYYVSLILYRWLKFRIFFFIYFSFKYFYSNSLGRSCQTLPLWVLRSALRRDLRSSSDYWESSNCFASSEYSSLPDISGPWRLWERHVNIDWLSRWLSSLLQSETVTESWGCFSFFSSWGFSSSPLSCMSLRTTWRELTSWRCWTPTGGRWLPWQLWDTATSPPPPSLDGL